MTAIRDQFDLGCDGVIMDGASPEELAPVVAAYRASGELSKQNGASDEAGS